MGDYFGEYLVRGKMKDSIGKGNERVRMGARLERLGMFHGSILTYLRSGPFFERKRGRWGFSPR